MSIREGFEHPAWLAIGGTTLGYLGLLVVLFLLLFVVPYVLFAFS